MELDFVLGKIADEFTFRHSDPDYQFLAFSHLTLPVGDGYMKMPREAETTFKSLVDAYGVALHNFGHDLDPLYEAYSNLFEAVYDFDFGDQHQILYSYPVITELKLSYFRGTVYWRKVFGEIKIHPQNNAWMLIPYAFRHVIYKFERDVATAFKMIPLVDSPLSKPVVGWVKIPDTTRFKTISLFVDDSVSVGKIGMGTFSVMEPFEGNISYPVMYKESGETPVSRDFYIKANEVIFYD
jgi:hypothetical protein